MSCLEKGCCRKLCSCLNCGLACATSHSKTIAALRVGLVSLCVLLTAVGMFGLSRSSSLMTALPWGVLHVKELDDASLPFERSHNLSFSEFDVNMYINIWGACVQWDAQGEANGTSFSDSKEACASWGDLDDAIHNGGLPSEWDCDEHQAFCLMFANRTSDPAVVGAYSSCSSASTALFTIVIVALLAVLLKLYTNVSSLRNELSAPEKNVTRNKCTSLLSLVIPLVMQGSAVSAYYSSCLTQYDDDVDHPVFETTSPGVGLSCFSLALQITSVILVIELITPSKWPGAKEASESAPLVKP